MTIEDIKNGKGSDSGVERLSVLAASGPCVFNCMEYELAGSALGGLDDALVRHNSCPFLFFHAVCAFEDCNF